MKGYRQDLTRNQTAVATFIPPPANIELPRSVDWRKAGAVTHVKDQSYPRSCGSCWAFSTCAYVQSRLVQLGQFDSSLDLSEQKLVECTSYSTCSGGYIEYAMKNAADNDIPR